MMATMKAAVIREPGAPEVLKIENLPIPAPKQGEVLIRVKACGLNRSELFTRQGHSPDVKFPACSALKPSDSSKKRLAANSRRVTSSRLSWAVLAASSMEVMPSTPPCPPPRYNPSRLPSPGKPSARFPRCCKPPGARSSHRCASRPGERLLIRGGTTSVGLAAAAIAKKHGNFVASTTRNPDREQLLRSSGADHIFIDDGSIAGQIKSPSAAFDKVLELIGVATLKDSLRCAGKNGIVCMTGIVGNQWSFQDFAPMEAIPTAVCLTSYAGESEDFMRMPLQSLIDQVADGSLHVQIGRVFHLDEIVEAHRLMESNKAGGKIVVLT